MRVYVDRITEIAHVTVAGKDRPVELPVDIELIDGIVAENEANLQIIEPLAAFLAGDDANKDQDIRRVLYRLSKVAQRRDCTTVTMRHLNKTSGGKAIYQNRSNVESVFSMIEARYRPEVPSRAQVAMRNTAYAKLLCHNTCMLIKAQCELG